MGGEEKQNVGEVFVEDHERRRHVHWAAYSNINKDREYGHESMDSSISSVNDSEASPSSSSASSLLSASSLSSEVADDASSSSSSSDSRGPLYELDELMAQLPVKKGLSKFYNGKSQTFTSLASVSSLADLAKKETPGYSKRMKSCKSYGGNLNHHNFIGPKATITKRSSPKGSFSPKGGSLLLNL